VARNELLVVKEVSKILKMSVPTVYRLTKKGEIKAVKIGNLWKYRREDVEYYFRKIDRSLLRAQIRACTFNRSKGKRVDPVLASAYRATLKALSNKK